MGPEDLELIPRRLTVSKGPNVEKVLNKMGNYSRSWRLNVLFPVVAGNLGAGCRIITPAAAGREILPLGPGERGRNEITKLPGELRGKKHEIAGRQRRIGTRNERNNRPMCPVEIKGRTQRPFRLLSISISPARRREPADATG